MDLLTQLLDEGAGFDPHYVPSMNTDHLPMALVALSNLGATEVVLKDFQTRYKERLRPVIDGPDVPSIAAGRGRFEAFAGIRQILNAEIAEKGVDEVLAQQLPALLPSLASGAFHPMIRLGFALRANHVGEVASALAYWLVQPFDPKLKPTKTGVGMRKTLETLDVVDVPPGRFGAGLSLLDEKDLYPAPLDTTLADCASASLDVYLGTRNFFALHFVTATQAARQCLPYANEDLMVQSLTAAIQAGYLVVGAPEVAQPLPAPAQLDEEHAIKYVYACSEELAFYGDVRYQHEISGFVDAGLVPKWIKVPE